MAWCSSFWKWKTNGAWVKPSWDTEYVQDLRPDIVSWSGCLASSRKIPMMQPSCRHSWARWPTPTYSLKGQYRSGWSNWTCLFWLHYSMRYQCTFSKGVPCTNSAGEHLACRHLHEGKQKPYGLYGHSLLCPQTLYWLTYMYIYSKTRKCCIAIAMFVAGMHFKCYLGGIVALNSFSQVLLLLDVLTRPEVTVAMFWSPGPVLSFKNIHLNPL